MADNTEIQRRRTFAIIAHPDAGKTSLTEKLLLFGGQIQVAGAVKSNKIKKTATSDWMEIEKQRGISVTTSVMEFDYRDYKINILDTPGHQDFAEDTYRTLTAVDSVIIVVDGAKGVETQTRKLMEVCRMRKTPVIIFVNKMDREGKDPFDLLDELEEELMIQVRPLSWPIEQGARFKGVYNIYEKKLDLYQPSKQVVTEKVEVDIHTEELDKQIGKPLADKLRGDLELIEGVYPELDVESYLAGDCAPVFFGSALNNFGVQELLNCFVEIAPSPRPVQAEEREVKPDEPKFTGFIFKITANIDPNHRSCVAFCKICSGKFVRNAPYTHVRHGKTMRFSSPTQFMAQRKTTIDEAYAIALKRKTFVSESILIGSAQDGRAAIIEKSPEKTALFTSSDNQIICTNHYQSDTFRNDERNQENIATSDSPYRFARLQELLKENKPIDPMKAASILRNQKGLDNIDLGMGNEMAINQLIAHHSVIFLPEKQIMYVSTSPWQCGKYMAYDLNKIFSDTIDFHHEIATLNLTIPEDNFIRQANYKQFMAYKQLTKLIREKTQRKETIETKVLNLYEASNPSFYYVYEILGNYYAAIQQTDTAITYWQKALTMPIAKQAEKVRIQQKINKKQ